MNRILLSALAPIFAATAALAATPRRIAKPPIVLVHGAWETSSIWAGVAAKLKQDGVADAIEAATR